MNIRIQKKNLFILLVLSVLFHCCKKAEYQSPPPCGEKSYFHKNRSADHLLAIEDSEVVYINIVEQCAFHNYSQSKPEFEWKYYPLGVCKDDMATFKYKVRVDHPDLVSVRGFIEFEEYLKTNKEEVVMVYDSVSKSYVGNLDFKKDFWYSKDFTLKIIINFPVNNAHDTASFLKYVKELDAEVWYSKIR